MNFDCLWQIGRGLFKVFNQIKFLLPRLNCLARKKPYQISSVKDKLLITRIALIKGKDCFYIFTEGNSPNDTFHLTTLSYCSGLSNKRRLLGMAISTPSSLRISRIL